jgi:hypothetical protein
MKRWRVALWCLAFGAIFVFQTNKASAQQGYQSPPPQQGYQNPPPQQTQTPPPPKGTGGIIAGSILTGLGVINLAATGMCFVEGGDFGLGTDVCVGVQLGAGGFFVLLGVPLLIAGGVRRSRYKDWLQGNQVALSPVISPNFSGFALSFAF